MAPFKWLFKAGQNQFSLTALSIGGGEAAVKITMTVQSQGFSGSGSGAVSQQDWQQFQIATREVLAGKRSIASLTADKDSDFELRIESAPHLGEAKLVYLSGRVSRAVVDAEKPFVHQLHFGFSGEVTSDLVASQTI
jgi:hypothetical protein